MGKFSNILGVKKFTVGDTELEIRPKMGDNRRLINIMNDEKSMSDKLNGFEKYTVKLLTREYPDEKENEIKAFVEFNITGLMREILIAFNWTTRKKWEENQKNEEKKLMSNL